MPSSLPRLSLLGVSDYFRTIFRKEITHGTYFTLISITNAVSKVLRFTKSGRYRKRRTGW